MPCVASTCVNGGLLIQGPRTDLGPWDGPSTKAQGPRTPGNTASMPNLPLATQNLARVAQNRLAKLHRKSQKYSGRTSKFVRDTLKDGRVSLRRATRTATVGAYVGAVRFTRYWKKVNERTWPRLTTDVSVRLDLW